MLFTFSCRDTTPTSKINRIAAPPTRLVLRSPSARVQLSAGGGWQLDMSDRPLPSSFDDNE